MLNLTFFNNHAGIAIADLYLDERRLIATNHPATIVAAIYAMRETTLTVRTKNGVHSADIKFPKSAEDDIGVVAAKARLNANPALYTFAHLASSPTEKDCLEGLDLFAFENWENPPAVADEYIRTAHHHLPAEVIARPLLTPEPKDWKQRLKRRNEYVYYPAC